MKNVKCCLKIKPNETNTSSNKYKSPKSKSESEAWKLKVIVIERRLREDIELSVSQCNQGFNLSPPKL